MVVSTAFLKHVSKVLAVGLSAYFALWACAPAASMRPPTLDLDAPHEIGLAGVATTNNGATFAPDAQLWYEQRVGKKFSVGGTLFGGATGLVGVGALGRWHAVELDRFRLGVDFEGGFLYAAVGVPMAYRLLGDWWLYTSPSAGLRMNGLARLPVGTQFGIGEHVRISVEGGVDFFNSTLAPGSSDVAFVGGLAAAVRW
ncbi:hypothetical protein LBMAG42_02020 [Deltaproteobacteria bacterium]|nr:hypothetical protein LBMAG42_02020 [Deltaproteobacteria bacterium]